MRSPVRLRTHSIGKYARPETEAPRTMLVLAVLAAVGVLLPWAEGFGWSKHGWSYGEGLIALAAAYPAAAAAALRASDHISRRQYLRFAWLGALVGLGATLWFYFDVVGSTDPTNWLVSLFRPLRTRGAVGLYVSMAGFLAQIAVLIWHADFRVQQRMRMALCSPWTAVALVALAAIGVLLPWNEGFTSPERGWSYNEGLIALVAAIEAAIVCGLRLSGRVGLLPYAALGLLCAMAGFGAVAWFHFNMVRETDPTGYRLLVWWLNAPRSEAGLQESVSAAGFIGVMAILIWQLRQTSRSNI